MLLKVCRLKVGRKRNLVSHGETGKATPVRPGSPGATPASRACGPRLSQEQLADLAGVHRTYVGSVERAERNISIDNIEQLAAALGLDISKLLEPL
ncbi:MAG: helix-turn-helix transcriptional regulator [Burkholderiales bacterium]|nr:helix-turn-helix transcriptional regulator [Burkholderiales bacterium]